MADFSPKSHLPFLHTEGFCVIYNIQRLSDLYLFVCALCLCFTPSCNWGSGNSCPRTDVANKVLLEQSHAYPLPWALWLLMCYKSGVEWLPQRACRAKYVYYLAFCGKVCFALTHRRTEQGRDGPYVPPRWVLAMICGMWDLSSPTRDETRVHCSGRAES